MLASQYLSHSGFGRSLKDLPPLTLRNNHFFIRNKPCLLPVTCGHSSYPCILQSSLLYLFSARSKHNVSATAFDTSAAVLSTSATVLSTSAAVHRSTSRSQPEP